MCGLRQHLIGNAIRLPLIRIAQLVDPKFWLQSQYLLLAALFAFAGESRSPTTARALALQHQACARAMQRFARGILQGSHVAHRDIPLAIVRPAEVPSRCGLASCASLTVPTSRLDTRPSEASRSPAAGAA